MNPPVTRGTRATYPVPSGRHTPEYPHQIHHAASVQFGHGSRDSGNPGELDPAVYGQYRKAEFYAGQNAQYNPSSLRRSADDDRRRVSVEDDQVHAVRQRRDQTVVRPRSVNATTRRETANQAQGARSPAGTGGKSGHKNKSVQRPRSVTFALPDENVYSSMANQQKDLRMQQAGTPQDSRYSATPPEEGGYSRAGYHTNQSPQQSFHRANTAQQGTGNPGEYKGRNASYRVACGTANQQRARAMQQHNGYEVMNPIDYSKTNGSCASPPEYADSIARLQQRSPDKANHGAENVTQQRTAFKILYDQNDPGYGYEEMRPLHHTPAVHSSATTGQNAAYRTTGIYQNSHYSTAPSQQNPPYSSAATQQTAIHSQAALHQHPPYSSAATQQSPPHSTVAAQYTRIHSQAVSWQNPPHSRAANQQSSPYSTAATQHTGIHSQAASHQNPPYSGATTQQSSPYSTVATQQTGIHSQAASRQNPPRNRAATLPHGTRRHAATQLNTPYSTTAAQQNGTYDHGSSQQSGTYHPSSVAQKSPPYSTAATQQDGVYGHVTGQQSGTHNPALAAYQSTPYSTAAAQQNGTYYPPSVAQESPSYGTAASQQNGTYYPPSVAQESPSYGTAASQQNGTYYPPSVAQQSPSYSTAATQQNGGYSPAAGRQNGTYPRHASTAQQSPRYSTAATQQNGAYSHSTGQQTHPYRTKAEQQNDTYSHASNQQSPQYNTAATQENGSYHQGHGVPRGYSEVPQQNGYDGYDSSDSDFDDTDEDDDPYDYVNLRQWNGAENGSNNSTDQDACYQQSDR